MNAADAVLAPAFTLGRGEQIAVRGAAEAVTYRQVRERMLADAGALAGLGVGTSQRVLLLLRDSPALVCAYLGVMAAGAVAVTLNPRSTPAELAHVVQDSACALALLDPEFVPLWRNALPDGAPAAYTVGGAVPGLPRWEPLAGASPPLPRPVLVAETEMAFWIYTSGTTGEMKACVHRHQDVLLADAYLREILGVGAGMRLFATSKLFFAYALGTCLFGALRLGATTLLLDAWPTPENVAEFLERHRPHVVFSVPAFYRALLASGVTARPAFRRVSTWVSAGERLPEVVFHRWREVTGAAIVEGMGTSETLYMILTHRPGQARAGCTGRPAPGVEARLADAGGRPVPAGRPGILQVRMASTSPCYWNQPERSAAAFRNGWFITGDVFTIDAQGCWRHGGRAEDRIPAPEGNLNPADIEEALQALPGVADACVMAKTGNGQVPPVVFAVSAPGTEREALAADIRRVVARWLPPPGPAATVHWLEELPRTASGKVQRYRLRKA
jgi:benzoate-CoA ligase